MLAGLFVRRFKKLENAEIKLGSPSLFVGPSSYGKSTALQALMLWHQVLKCLLHEKEQIFLSVGEISYTGARSAQHIWSDNQVRLLQKGNTPFEQAPIEVTVDWSQDGTSTQIGIRMHFESSNFVRLSFSEEATAEHLVIVRHIISRSMLYVQPISSVPVEERLLSEAEILATITSGYSGHVLRNLCHLAATRMPEGWAELCSLISKVFGCDINPPACSNDGALSLSYGENWGTEFEISTASRAVQQLLFLLCICTVFPDSILLVDELEAGFDVYRQRLIFRFISKWTRNNQIQLIASTQSHILLDNAGRGITITSFLGNPHPIESHSVGSISSETEFRSGHLVRAKNSRWILYLEGTSDLEILRAFAARLNHKASEFLKSPSTFYVGDKVSGAHRHFRSLKAALPNLLGFALFDRVPGHHSSIPDLTEHRWKRREIENYFCSAQALVLWVESIRSGGENGTRLADYPFFLTNREIASNSPFEMMLECLSECASDEYDKLTLNHTAAMDAKVSDELLEPILAKFFKRLKPAFDARIPKSTYADIVRFVPSEQIDPEVSIVLDGIAHIATAVLDGSSGTIRK